MQKLLISERAFFVSTSCRIPALHAKNAQLFFVPNWPPCEDWVAPINVKQPCVLCLYKLLWYAYMWHPFQMMCSTMTRDEIMNTEHISLIWARQKIEFVLNQITNYYTCLFAFLFMCHKASASQGLPIQFVLSSGFCNIFHLKMTCIHPVSGNQDCYWEWQIALTQKLWQAFSCLMFTWKHSTKPCISYLSQS